MRFLALLTFLGFGGAAMAPIRAWLRIERRMCSQVADNPSVCTAQQLCVILSVFIPSPREVDNRPPRVHHMSQLFLWVQLFAHARLLVIKPRSVDSVIHGSSARCFFWKTRSRHIVHQSRSWQVGAHITV